MKNFKVGRKLKKNSKLQAGMQGTVANGTVVAGSSKEHSAFRYGIAKISNFARIAKLGIFARLAKFTVDSEISQCHYLCRISLG